MSNRCRFRAAVLLPLALIALPATMAAQVQVSVRPVFRPEAIYVSDLTPTGARKLVDLLAFTLIRPPGSDGPVQLRMTVTRERPTSAEIFRGTSDLFTLGTGARHFTSRELFSRGHDVSITDYSFAGESSDRRNQVGHTGRLPAGTYVFELQVLSAQGVLLGGGEARLDLSNPTRLALIAPGGPIEMSPQTVNTMALRFIWSPDGATPGNLYKLRVVRTNGAVSGEEAMQGNASWETLTPGTSELYPGSAEALRLEPGATYAWQVTREVRSSGGVELLQSPIFWFRAGGPGQGTATISGDDAFALRLMQLLESLGLADDVAGYRPVSARLQDGRPVALSSLEALLTAIAAGEIALISAFVR